MNIGDVVYIIESWTDAVVKCVVTHYEGSSYLIKSVCSVNDEGIEVDDRIGSYFIDKTTKVNEKYFLNYKNAFNYKNKKHESIKSEYINEIKNIPDLVKFPLMHCLNGEEYTDYDAIEVYKMKCKELLNIDL